MTLKKKDLEKFKKLTWQEKNSFLRRLTWEYDYLKAVSLLPLELSPFDLSHLPDEALQTYLIFAKVIANNGAEAYGLRLLKRFLAEVESRDFNNPLLLFAIHTIVIALYSDASKDEEIIAYAEKVLQNTPSTEPQGIEVYVNYIKWKKLYALFTLEKISTEDFLKGYEELKPYLPQDQTSQSYYQALKVIGLILYSTWPLEKFLPECNELLNSTPTSFTPYLLVNKVRILQHMGKLKEAYELCLKAKEEFSPSLPHIYVYCLSQINALCYDSLSFEEAIIVRAYPFIDFSLFKDGNIIHKNKETNNDVWFIEEQRITSSQYEKISNQYPCLDLKSAVYINHQGQIELLSPLRTKALELLIASSTMGCSLMQLAEKLFSEENLEFKCLTKRVQDIVGQLIKMGFPIIRREKRFYFDVLNYQTRIILPKTKTSADPIYFMKKSYQSLNSKDLCAALNISRASSWNYIGQWCKQGLIKKSPTKPGQYLFTHQ